MFFIEPLFLCQLTKFFYLAEIFEFNNTDNLLVKKKSKATKACKLKKIEYIYYIKVVFLKTLLVYVKITFERKFLKLKTYKKLLIKIISLKLKRQNYLMRHSER